MLEAVRSFLRRLTLPRRLMVAVSGGSDSLGLLLSFHRVLAEKEFAQFSLSAVTVDHGLRQESAAEAKMVAHVCAHHNIQHCTKTWLSEKPKSGLSDASRIARYHFLCEAAQECGADIILLGHTKGDQRETIVMRQMRSSDAEASGLAGMAEATLIQRQIWACRPFLSIEREDIRSFLAELGQDWVDDPSNENLHYERVQVRERLKFEQDAEDDGAAARRYSLSAQAAQFVTQAVTLHPHFLLSVDRQLCRKQPQAAAYALSYLAAVIGGQAYPLAQRKLAPLMDLILGEGTGRHNTHRCLFDLRKSHVYLYHEQRNLPLPLKATPAHRILWDHRLWIEPDRAPGAFCGTGAPASLLRAAFKAMPYGHLKPDDFSPAYRIEAYLRPFDQFLPLFDYALALAIAHQFAALSYPAPPFDAFHP